jgi:hypothetical protein
VSLVVPHTPLELADNSNIANPSSGTPVVRLNLHEFVEVVFQNTESELQSWHREQASNIQFRLKNMALNPEHCIKVTALNIGILNTVFRKLNCTLAIVCWHQPSGVAARRFLCPWTARGCGIRGLRARLGNTSASRSTSGYGVDAAGAELLQRVRQPAQRLTLAEPLTFHTG